MSYQPTHWEALPEPNKPYQLGPEDFHDDLVVEAEDTAPVVALPVPGLVDVTVEPVPTTEMHDWESVLGRDDIDASTIHVRNSDLARILNDRSLNQALRSGQISHDAIQKFGELAEVDPELIPNAEALADRYYNPAQYVINTGKSNVMVEIVAEMIDENLEPIMKNTPVPIAMQYKKLAMFKPEGELGLVMTKLWAADTYGFDLPAAYRDILRAKATIKRGSSSGFLY